MEIKVLICDDEPAFVDQMAQAVQSQPLPAGVSMNIIKTTRPEELTDEQLRQCQLMFLDIDMEERSGMEIARCVRKLGLDTILIFVTHYVQFSPEGYEVSAFRYLLKQELQQKLPGYFCDALTEILREEKVTDCGGVLHCFTEDRETAGKLLDLGFYISFSGIVTFRNAEQLRDAARYVPLDRLLVETDSPYLAPVPHRGKENQPAMVRDVAEYMAVLKGVAVEELAQVTTDNFARLFHIDASRLQSIR